MEKASAESEINVGSTGMNVSVLYQSFNRNDTQREQRDES